MAGLRAHCASILSEEIEEEADLSGIGRLLAMTANDEVNMLATREYSHLFGTANVYQLPPNGEAGGARGSVKDKLLARELFGGGLNQRRMNELFREGYELKATTLTEEFTLDDFRERYSDASKILFLVDADKRVQVSVAGETLKSVGRQTVIALIPPIESAAENELGEAVR